MIFGRRNRGPVMDVPQPEQAVVLSPFDARLRAMDHQLLQQLGMHMAPGRRQWAGNVDEAIPFPSKTR